jgi:hypothetical protein
MRGDGPKGVDLIDPLGGRRTYGKALGPADSAVSPEMSCPARRRLLHRGVGTQTSAKNVMEVEWQSLAAD